MSYSLPLHTIDGKDDQIGGWVNNYHPQ
jgi:hypothetical protein